MDTHLVAVGEDLDAQWPPANSDNRVFEFTNQATTITQQPHAAALDVIASWY